MMVEAAVTELKLKLPVLPEIGVVLGSGLGSFADEVEDPTVIPYADIPHWPASTAVGHAGKLVVGRIAGRTVAVLAGRAHLYEGYTPAQSTFAMRVLGNLGTHSVILTNAAGGIKATYQPGDLVLITDHLNLQGVNPLSGPNNEAWGPRFPGMTFAYTPAYQALALQTAQQLGFNMPTGVYAGLLGPSYETPAEIRYLRAIGADLVGMSTVAEVIVAAHMRMKVLAFSCVTNMAAGMLNQELNHEEVLETGRQQADRFKSLLRAVIPQLHAQSQQ
ncbi:MAG: purine-nucleoside phosphorylase [Acidobacteria bacterium]|nr:purine-nucleoside phosphorylase [Acidobacteriota bacterium]